MANITLRSVKGSALTFQEGDDNFTNLNNDKIEAVEDDNAPKLGGPLDVNGFIIEATGDSDLDPGAGDIVFRVGDNGAFVVQSDGIEIDSDDPDGAYLSSGPDQDMSIATGDDDTAYITIQAGANGSIEIAPVGTGKTVTNRLNYNEAVHSIGTTSGTVAPNAANGNVQTITLNGNITLNAFTSPVAGQSITLIVNTNGTNRTLTSSMKWADGEKTLSTTDTTDIITVFYDGTNYWASLVKDFK